MSSTGAMTEPCDLAENQQLITVWDFGEAQITKKKAASKTS
jgi:hypothetical protein